ncbi:MAG: hypothetical protein KKF68_02990 [Nanoarchaeota archaeon]|nr:hypothetical protein [Nanoarchaeota archaeon]
MDFETLVYYDLQIMLSEKNGRLIRNIYSQIEEILLQELDEKNFRRERLAPELFMRSILSGAFENLYQGLKLLMGRGLSYLTPDFTDCFVDSTKFISYEELTKRRGFSQEKIKYLLELGKRISISDTIC